MTAPLRRACPGCGRDRPARRRCPCGRFVALAPRACRGCGCSLEGTHPSTRYCPPCRVAGPGKQAECDGCHRWTFPRERAGVRGFLCYHCYAARVGRPAGALPLARPCPGCGVLVDAARARCSKCGAAATRPEVGADAAP